MKQMFFKKFVFLTICLSLSSCVVRKQITSKTVTHNYFNLNFSPEIITQRSVNETEISITPIDAKNLNEETFAGAMRDGNYEKELATSIEGKKGKLEGLSKQEKNWVLGKINAIENIIKLEQGKIIPSEIAYRLKMRIWYGKEEGRDGTEVTSLSDIKTYSDEFNPFKVNKKYLSIFKVTFENKGKEVEKISLKEFQVISGEEQLYPLGSDYFENNLKEEPEKIKNAYRMNMPTELTITPNQRITKFIAIPAINSKNDKLQIQFIREKKVTDFNFVVKEKSMERSYNLENYNFNVAGDGDAYYHKFYYALGYKDGVSFTTKENRVFVATEKANSPLSIYGIGINTSNSQTLFGLVNNIEFADFPKKIIKIQFKRVKQ